MIAAPSHRGSLWPLACTRLAAPTSWTGPAAAAGSSTPSCGATPTRRSSSPKPSGLTSAPPERLQHRWPSVPFPVTRSSTERQTDDRPSTCPIRTQQSGQQRSGTAPRDRSHTTSSSTKLLVRAHSTAREPLIPKLGARVRFSSPAPRLRLRSSTRALLVVWTCLGVPCHIRARCLCFRRRAACPYELVEAGGHLTGRSVSKCW